HPHATKTSRASPAHIDHVLPMTPPIDQDMFARIHAEAIDSFDEELEMEFDDLVGDPPSDPASAEAAASFRRLYFRELLRLQCELVKLQEWVIHSKHKIVVLFEGRDAAGKGGVIKR